MASRSGGTPIRTRKVEPGPDQAFTLPKGTSAAPIKQVKTSLKTKASKKKWDEDDTIMTALIGGSGLLAIPSIKLGKVAKESRKKKEKKQRTETRKKQRGMSSGGSVNSRAIAKKYFRGGLV